MEGNKLELDQKPLALADSRKITITDEIPYSQFAYKDHYSKLRLVNNLKREIEKSLLFKAGKCADCWHSTRTNVVEVYDAERDKSVLKAEIMCTSRECKFSSKGPPDSYEMYEREKAWRDMGKRMQGVKPAEFDPEEYIQANPDFVVSLATDGNAGSW